MHRGASKEEDELAGREHSGSDGEARRPAGRQGGREGGHSGKVPRLTAYFGNRVPIIGIRVPINRKRVRLTACFGNRV